MDHALSFKPLNF